MDLQSEVAELKSEVAVLTQAACILDERLTSFLSALGEGQPIERAMAAARRVGDRQAELALKLQRQFGGR